MRIKYVMDDSAQNLKAKIEKLENILKTVSLAAKSSRMGIWEANLNGFCIWDEEMFRHYGVTKSNFTPTLENWRKFVHPDDLPNVDSAIYQALKLRKPYQDVNFRIITPAGVVKHIEAHGQVTYSDENTVVGMIGANVDVSEKMLYIKKIAQLAHYDQLTKLSNRAHLFEKAEHLFSIAKRDKKLVGVYYIDLDNFKPINDKYGHLAGDYVLQETAKRLRANVRESDVVARIGGDEFVILAYNIRDNNDAISLMEKLKTVISAPMEQNSKNLSVSCSIGFGIYPEHSENINELLSIADNSMYKEKTSKIKDMSN